MTKPRFYYIDFLRVIAILMMFIFHVNMISVAEDGWHIKDKSASNVLMELNYCITKPQTYMFIALLNFKCLVLGVDLPRL